MIEGFSLGNYLLLVEYTGRMFREGKAAISSELAGVIERLGSNAENWQGRLQKLAAGRLLGRCFAASRARRPSLLIDISDQLEAKDQALRCYRSQLVDNQPAGKPGVIDSVCDRTRFWGHMVGVEHAEPFASREPVGMTSLDHLLL